MDIIKIFSSLRFLFHGFIAISLACESVSFVRASEVLITAEFKPNALDPAANKFTNTTPLGTYCSWKPAECRKANIYMFDIQNSFTKIYTKGATLRQRWYVGFPPQRQVSLRSDLGHTATANIAVAAYSGQVSPGETTNPVFTTSVGAGCGYAYTGMNAAWARHGWFVRNPSAPAPCYSQGDGGAEGFTGQYDATIGIGLEITTDSPLSLRNGVYEGSLTYTLGGIGSDFDFGDDVTVSDNILELKFKFTVAHELVVEFSPGSDRALLVPEGGWNSWIDHGRVPTHLSKDLPFSLSSSAPFRITLTCQYPQPGGDCGLRNMTTPTEPEVPVEVAVTMPGFYQYGRNADALKLKLSHQNPARFTSDAYAANRASRLHFDVNGGNVKSILDHPGSQYRGNVTVVFDAQP